MRPGTVVWGPVLAGARVSPAHHLTQASPVAAVRQSAKGFVNSDPPAHLSKRVLAHFCLSHCGDILLEGFSLGLVLDRTVLLFVCPQDLISGDHHMQHRELQGEKEYWENSGLFPSITENRSLFLNLSGLEWTLRNIRVMDLQA